MTETMEFDIDVMIDIETLATAPDAAILSVGAVPFHLDGHVCAFEPMRWTINLQDSIRHGLRIDQRTIEWWMTQSDEARMAWVDDPDKMDFWQFFSELRSWLHRIGGSHMVRSEVRIWGHGPHFDMAIIDHASWKIDGRPAPWRYNAVRDTRTLWHAAGIDWDTRIQELNPDSAHDPVADARAQATLVQEAWALIQGWKNAVPKAIAAMEVVEQRLEDIGDIQVVTQRNTYVPTELPPPAVYHAFRPTLESRTCQVCHGDAMNFAHRDQAVTP